MSVVSGGDVGTEGQLVVKMSDIGQVAAMNTPIPAHRTWPWWLAAFAWFIVTSLAHLEFSLWLVRTREGPFGPYQISDFVPWAGTASALGLVSWLFLQSRACPRRARFWLWWGVWLVCVALFDRFLTFSLNETAHYPPYAFLAWLLGHALDSGRSRWTPGRILFWTTLLGMVDEIQQYIWIAPSYGMHLDFNDFLVNLMAAAAGVMLYYGFRAPQQENMLPGAIHQASPVWRGALDRTGTLPGHGAGCAGRSRCDHPRRTGSTRWPCERRRRQATFLPRA